jgi:hypothetical protein
MNSGQFEYKKFYDEVGERNGWDFSRLKVVTEGEQWDFYSEVVQRCSPSGYLLDIGTGGGERLLAIADSALLLVGIDQSAGMIQTAKQNQAKAAKPNVRFFQMAAERLEFPDGFFHIASCRHSDFSAKQLAKVLAADGIFLTQQVSEHDKFNLKTAFGRGQDFRTADGTMQEKYVAELTEAGFTQIQCLHYDAVEYYATYEDLVFLLKYTPIIPNFGQNEEDFLLLDQFIADNRTGPGIRTNSKRFMIIAAK